MSLVQSLDDRAFLSCGTVYAVQGGLTFKWVDETLVGVTSLVKGNGGDREGERGGRRGLVERRNPPPSSSRICLTFTDTRFPYPFLLYALVYRNSKTYYTVFYHDAGLILFIHLHSEISPFFLLFSFLLFSFFLLQ